MDDRGHRVLVTGGTGFIGRYLVDALLGEGRHVRVLARSGGVHDLESRGVEIHAGDVTDPASLRGAAKGIDVIYHLAGAGHVGANSEAARRRLELINVGGVDNLANEALERGNITRFVHFSSTAAMGLIEGTADERSPCRPETPYQQSKYEGEQTVMRRYAEDGLPVVILRPSMVYGPGDRNTDFLSMCRLVKRGLFPVVASLKSLTPLVHVSDVVRAALPAANRGCVGEAYIITSERSHPVRELVEAIADGLGVPRGCVTVPRWALYAVAAGSEVISRLVGTPPALTRRRLKSILADRSFDISKAVEGLDYVPLTSLRDGVIGTIEWYKRMGYL